VDDDDGDDRREIIGIRSR